MTGRVRSSAGYAMLTTLLIMVLATTFALVAVAAVHGVQVVESADAGAWRSVALEAPALAAVTASLRWRPLQRELVEESATDASDGVWRAETAPAPPVTGSLWPRIAVQAATAWGGATWRDGLMLELRSEPWAMGVTCEGDAEVQEELSVTGCGVYVGGCLRGRENVRFLPGSSAMTPEGLPSDGVHGELFRAAGVHAGVGVYAGGEEIHEASGPSAFPADTDRHTGAALPPDWLGGPSAELLLAAETGAMSPGSCFSEGRLRLADVSPAEGAAVAEGRCLLVTPADEVVLEGSPPAEAGRLLILVCGDAVVGQPGEDVVLSGGLVVCGSLTLRGDVTLTGSLHAGRLVVEAPASVTIEPGWRGSPLPAAAAPTVVERG